MTKKVKDLLAKIDSALTRKNGVAVSTAVFDIRSFTQTDVDELIDILESRSDHYTVKHFGPNQLEISKY